MSDHFLSYSDWCDKYGEKYVTPKYSSKGVRGVDVNRCQKIAASKNGKIQERNKTKYREYFKDFEYKNDLSGISGESDMGEDLFKTMLTYLCGEGRRDEAEKILEKSGKFKKNNEGKWEEIK